MAPHSPHTYQIKIDFATSGDNTIVAAPASGFIKIHGYYWTVDGNTNYILKHGVTAFTGAIRQTGDGASSTLPISDEPWYSCQPGEAFIINSSNAVTFGGSLWYSY